MDCYLFGVRRGWLEDAEVQRYEAVAEKHGVDFYYCNMPGEGLKSWFSGPNMGAPFDRRLAESVQHDLKKAGVAQ